MGFSVSKCATEEAPEESHRSGPMDVVERGAATRVRAHCGALPCHCDDVDVYVLVWGLKARVV